ncbi:unnamed protein product, partial [Timema podura]|nr:unnamed protein product [Timema podura]
MQDICVTKASSSQAAHGEYGREAGTALSFVSTGEVHLKENVESHLKLSYGSHEKIFKAYQFKLEELESFNYRANDAWRAVTRTAVREARLKEIKQEIFNCRKLQVCLVS